jgi:hypothetical protein
MFVSLVKFVIDHEARNSKATLLRALLAESVLIILFGFPPEQILISEFEGASAFFFGQVATMLAIWSVMGFIIFFTGNLGYMIYYSLLDDHVGTLHSKKRLMKLVAGTGLLVYFLWFLGGWNW